MDDVIDLLDSNRTSGEFHEYHRGKFRGKLVLDVVEFGYVMTKMREI